MIKENKPEMENHHSGDQYLNYLPERPRRKWAENLMSNLALTALIIITLSSIHNSQIPDGKTVLTAVQDMIDSPWDESLGKISFVSNMFPDAVSVFFSDSSTMHFISPCFGNISHSWTENEPYLSFSSDDTNVYAPASGEIMSIFHGNDDEKVIRIRHDGDMESILYGMDTLHVKEGDYVETTTLIGNHPSDRFAILEIRKDGIAIDPTEIIHPRSTIIL